MYASGSTSNTGFEPNEASSSRRESDLPLYSTDLEEKESLHRKLTAISGLGNTRRRRRRIITGLAVFGLISTGAVWSQWAKIDYGRVNIISSHDTNPVVSLDEAEALPLEPSSTIKDTGHAPVPSTDLQKWGLQYKSEDLLSDLIPWPDNPAFDDQPPLSSLGHFADSLYNFGPTTLSDYFDQLSTFIDHAFPKKMVKSLNESLAGYVHTDTEAKVDPWDERKAIWQTDKDEKLVDGKPVTSWKSGSAKDEGWKWEMLTDAKANKYISKYLAKSRIETVWNMLPSGILRSDMLRYLLLYLEGGIYSDTDTVLLKAPSNWGRGAKLWREGAGWLDSALLDKVQAGENIEKELGPPSIIIGIEADVGEREDWYDWWPRPMQIAQWTIASAPRHPVSLSALLRILHATARAIDWNQKHVAEVTALNDQGLYEKSQALLDVNVLSVPSDGGPVGIMDWTGPGVWTDSALSYLKVKYGLVWTDLRDIRTPLRVGDVLILPVTGFSPGVGQFGSEEPWSAQAMVEHKFRGSWKIDGKKSQ